MSCLFSSFCAASGNLPSLLLRLSEERIVPSVCFTGHRSFSVNVASALEPVLRASVLEAYLLGFRNFYCGAALGFDLLAGFTVLSLRESCPDLHLTLVIPCADQSRFWSSADKQRWESLIVGADEVIIKSPSYYAGCMQVRNRFMVDHSHLCICFLSSFRGGTFSTVRYAQKKGLPILNLALPVLQEQRTFSDSLLREADHFDRALYSYPLLPPKVPLLRFRIFPSRRKTLGIICRSASSGSRPSFHCVASFSPHCRNHLYRRRHAFHTASSAFLPYDSGTERLL